jgi:serine-type D-Ala-D-Ala carboxypeptidase/endopeptidase (penicillin-binding protein 4)
MAQKPTTRRIKKLFDQSELMQEHFVGFVLEDQKGKVIFSQNKDKYFIPASNTKYLTLLSALNMLGDSIPALQFEIAGDSLIFWGTGDPTFLHPELDNGKVYRFLAESPKKLFMANANPIDFEPSYWRADLSTFPIYGNKVHLQVGAGGVLESTPRSIITLINMDSTMLRENFVVERNKLENRLIYPNMSVPIDFKAITPFPVNIAISRSLLADTLKREVHLINRKKPASVKTLYSIPSDSLYRQMMLPSDNFLAEQLLLVCSGLLSDTLEVQNTINFITKSQFAQLPHPPVWVDGSGLSRYNLFTPNAILQVLHLLEQKIADPGRLRNLLPAGGVSGTLRFAYKTDQGKPFVWAKTGSLSHVHLQSGWLDTSKGRTFKFVFMNNNYVKPTAVVREEMVRIMTEIHEKY